MSIIAWVVFIEAQSHVCKIYQTYFSTPVDDLTIAAMDISADLHELTRCPVGLVSGGVKSILDISRSAKNDLLYLVYVSNSDRS